MATLVHDLPQPQAVSTTCEPHPQPDPFLLPRLPYEDVYLYVKRIDNSRVLRPSHPAARRASRRALCAAALSFALLILLLLPDVLWRMAGHQLVRLEQQHQALLRQKAELDLEEAALLSPARLADWARNLQLVDPPPGQLATLAPKPDRVLAARTSVR